MPITTATGIYNASITPICGVLSGEIENLDFQTNKLEVYPNPTNGNFILKFSEQIHEGDLKIYDINGKLVHHENIGAWSHFKKVELTGINEGIYFCKMKWEEKEMAIKIIIE